MLKFELATFWSEKERHDAIEWYLNLSTNGKLITCHFKPGFNESIECVWENDEMFPIPM